MNVFEQDILRKEGEKLAKREELKRQQRLTREFSDRISELIGIEPLANGVRHNFKEIVRGYYLCDSDDYAGQSRPDAPGDGKPFWHGWKYNWWYEDEWLETEKLRSEFLRRLEELVNTSRDNDEPSPFWREQDLVPPITA